jgi:hypothetical protein
MLKFVLAALVFAFAGAVSADTDNARYHTMSGRTLVWHAPKAEKPAYALTGRQAPAAAEKPRLEIRQHGRAGNSVEPAAGTR